MNEEENKKKGTENTRSVCSICKSKRTGPKEGIGFICYKCRSKGKTLDKDQNPYLISTQNVSLGELEYTKRYLKYDKKTIYKCPKCNKIWSPGYNKKEIKGMIPKYLKRCTKCEYR